MERFGTFFHCCFGDSWSPIVHILHIGYLTCKVVKLCKLANMAGSAGQLSHPLGMGAIQDDKYFKWQYFGRNKSNSEVSPLWKKCCILQRWPNNQFKALTSTYIYRPTNLALQYIHIAQWEYYTTRGRRKCNRVMYIK